MKAVLTDGLMLYVKIDYSEPVELSDFARSMQGFADDFKATQTANPKYPNKLHICEIKKGSIVAVLSTLAPPAMDMLGNFDTIISYVTHIKNITSWLLKKAEKPENVSKQELTNLSKIVAPAAADPHAQIHIGTVENHGNGTINIMVNINSTEANAIQAQGRNEIANMTLQEQILESEVISGTHKYVLMYWAQIAASKTTDQAIIESIWPYPVKVMMTEQIKQELVLNQSNPFHKAFLIDVSVETIDGKPKIYKIIKHRETIDKD